MKQFVARWVQKRLELAMQTVPVVVLAGARQTGKSTLVRNLYPERRYVTLDDLDVLEQTQRDPDSLLARPPLTIDEVQRAPELLLAIKRKVDAGRRPGDFLLTGSTQFALMRNVAESLAGRAVYLDLYPFCPREWLGIADGEQLISNLFDADENFRGWSARETESWGEWVVSGGLAPALELDDHESRSLWLGGYVQTYLERDLRDLSTVSSLPDFQRMMRIAAQRTGRRRHSAAPAEPSPTPRRCSNGFTKPTGWGRRRGSSGRRSSPSVTGRAPGSGAGRTQTAICGVGAPGVMGEGGRRKKAIAGFRGGFAGLWRGNRRREKGNGGGMSAKERAEQSELGGALDAAARADMVRVAPGVHAWVPAEHARQQVAQYVLCRWSRQPDGSYAPVPLPYRMVRLTPETTAMLGFVSGNRRVRADTLQRLATAGFIECVRVSPHCWLLDLDSWFRHLSDCLDDPEYWDEAGAARRRYNMANGLGAGRQ